MKKFILLLFMLAAIFSFGNTLSMAVMVDYQITTFSDAVVACDRLNVRKGPGIGFPSVYKVSNGEKLKVFAKIDSWYLIRTEDNHVGMVSGDFIKPVNSIRNKEESVSDASSQKQLLSLVNNARKKAGLKLFHADRTLNSIAMLKARDMVQNNYFSHHSKVYGSVFDLLKKHKVKVKTAGENIAGNKTVKGAFDNWMKSAMQKKNLLNRNYNYTGIAVVDSKRYGKIIVQEFVGR